MPRIGLLGAEDQADQRRLARTVGADQADPVPAHDAGGEIVEQGALTEAQGDILQLGDELAGALPGDRPAD